MLRAGDPSARNSPWSREREALFGQ